MPNVRSRFHEVNRNREHNIVWIEDDCDANGDAKMSVTNDAENVVTWFRSIYVIRKIFRCLFCWYIDSLVIAIVCRIFNFRKAIICITREN